MYYMVLSLIKIVAAQVDLCDEMNTTAFNIWYVDKCITSCVLNVVEHTRNMTVFPIH